MWLRAKVVVAEREHEDLRATVDALREALAAVDGVDDEMLPDGPDADETTGHDPDDADESPAR